MTWTPADDQRPPRNPNPAPPMPEPDECERHERAYLPGETCPDCEIADETCTEHPDAATAERHDCYPDGSTLTLYRPRTEYPNGKNPVQRSTLTMEYDERHMETGAPDTMRARYDAIKEGLDANQR